jgi:hypothetical protein
MEKQLLQEHQAAQMRGARALAKEREQGREQKERLRKIKERRNKALQEAYDRASRLVERYRSLHEGSEEQTHFPPTSIPETADFHREFGVAVIRSFLPKDIDATEAAQLHGRSTQTRMERKERAEAYYQKRAHYRFEEAHLRLSAERVSTR